MRDLKYRLSVLPDSHSGIHSKDSIRNSILQNRMKINQISGNNFLKGTENKRIEKPIAEIFSLGKEAQLDALTVYDLHLTEDPMIIDHMAALYCQTKHEEVRAKIGEIFDRHTDNTELTQYIESCKRKYEE